MHENILLNIMAEDRNMVPYRPALARELGSVTAVILLQQVIYWWQRSDGKPFYKFKQPCSYPLYREGDSWTEELGFSRREFDSALKRIATKKTKDMSITEAMEANTPVVYWTNAGHVTYYTINERALFNLLEEAYDDQGPKAESAFGEGGKRHCQRRKAPSAEAENAFRITETTRDYQRSSSSYDGGCESRDDDDSSRDSKSGNRDACSANGSLVVEDTQEHLSGREGEAAASSPGNQGESSLSEDPTEDQREALEALMKLPNMNPATAEWAARKYRRGHILGYVVLARGNTALKNPAGFVLSQLKTGKPPWEPGGHGPVVKRSEGGLIKEYADGHVVNLEDLGEPLMF